MEHITPEGVGDVPIPYSPVVVSGDLVAVSGQVPFDEHGTLVSSEFAEQAQQVFRNLERCLRAAGCSMADVVKVNAYLESFDHFDAYNEVYRTAFSAPFPARTTVQVGLLGFLIEVDVLARRPSGG
jgi:2-iminobutanoate/2-iminopropanoate deaminase